MRSAFSSPKMNGRIGEEQREFRLNAKICLTAAFCLLFTVLFYRQAVEYNGEYFSDLPAHIYYSVIGGDYSLLYFIMGLVFKLPKQYAAIALLESAIVVATFLLTEKYVRLCFKNSSSWAVWISAGALFLCSIYTPRYYEYYYSWSLITQPWHNITYFGMRLFSVPVFFYTLHIIERYRQCFTWKDWLVIAVPLMLSAAIKPNFLAGYSLALLCVLILDFVGDCCKKELSVSSFWRYVGLGSAVFPAVIILFFQMNILYGDQNGAAPESVMTIVFLKSQFFDLGMLKTAIGMVRDLAFPALVTVYGYKHFSRKEQFSWLLFLMTLIQRIILEETGPRASHGNFTWGIYNAGYLLFLFMIFKFIELVRMVPWKKKQVMDKFFTLAGSGLLCAHLFCGLQYFLMILAGKNYYF